jgi:hypothetical protein
VGNSSASEAKTATATTATAEPRIERGGCDPERRSERYRS